MIKNLWFEDIPKYDEYHSKTAGKKSLYFSILIFNSLSDYTKIFEYDF